MMGAALAAMSIASAAQAQNFAIPSINTAAPTPGLRAGFALPRINAGGGMFLAQRTALSGVTAQPALSPSYLLAEVVPTDPLVRQIQSGPTPVGLLADVDPASGVGVAGVPGAGRRIVRAVGPVVQTAAGPAVRAVDATTGVEFLALVPTPSSEPEVTNPGQLTMAKVVKVNPDSVILEREENGKTLTEILPPQRVYAAVRGGFVPAASLRRLRPGAEVLIPLTGPRGTIIITRPSEFRTRTSSVNGR
jgi:hypothetical protein